ncbi:MAG: LamG domain-containing protein, partial [Planctomycetes bacterium]|nr:LamG domain-containing protein [Planctomycetota bacterium]
MAKETIVSTDTFGEGWTKQNTMNTEIYNNAVVRVNPVGNLFIDGGNATDGGAPAEGSHYFTLNPDTGFAIIYKIVSGLPQPATLSTGSNSLYVGLRVGIAAAGHHIITEDTDGHYHFHAHSKWTGELSTSEARILDAYNYEAHRIDQPDNSGSWTGTTFEFIFPSTTHVMLGKGYFQTDSTAATETVEIRIWEGTDATGTLIFHQLYPFSVFAASSEISSTFNGFLEYGAGENYFFRISSTANFSLKTNAAVTLPWIASDVSDVHEDDILQTIEWISGDTFTDGQWSVQNRKIYVCNTTGIQTGTFASNIALWDILSSEGNNYWSRTGTTLSPKTAGDSVFIYEGANPICKLWDGDGNDAGTLSLYAGTTQYAHFSADEDSWITGGNLGIGDDDPMSDLHVRCNYPTPATTVGITLEQVGAGDCVTHYYLTGGQRVDTGIDNSTTNDDFVIGSGNFGVKYLSIDTPTNTVSVTNLNGNLVDGVTGTTQSADDNSTKIATTAYVDTAVSAEDLWDRSGTTISPKTAGDDITTTGDLTAANVTVGSNLGISQSGITNLVVGNTSGKSKLYFGQATNNNLVVEWTYDATPADAFARMTTWGYANDFYIDAKVLSLQANNSAGQVGIGTDDPQAKLDVRGDIRIGDWTSADVYLVGVPSSGGDFNIGQTSGAGNVKFVSNAGTDLITIQNDGDMGIGKVPTEELDVNGTAQATILKANNGILDSNETEGDILAITGDSLTAGTAISINSLSSSDILRNLIEISHSGTGNSTSAIDINLGASRGSILNGYSANTTQPGLRLDCNDLTYGAVAHFASSSADTNIRKLVHIQNSNALSTGTTGLVIDQASTGKAISTNGNITAGSYDGVLNAGVTATTQSTGDNSTKVATTAYADNVVSSEVYGSQDGQVLSIDFSQVGITTQYDKGPLANNATGTSAGLVTSTGGAFGGGAVLNGTTDYFTLSNSLGLPTGAAARTIEAYVKIDDITLQSGVIFRYGTETGDDVFSLEQIDAALRIFTNNDSSNTGNILSEGNWFLIQATYNGTQVNMWVNGVKVITNDAITVNTASGTTPYIGSRGGSSDYFDGNIDFVRVYDRVLTDDEIKVSYLRYGGDSVITSNAAKVINTSGESRNIAGLDPAYAVDVFSLTDLPTAAAGVIT